MHTILNDNNFSCGLAVTQKAVSIATATTGSNAENINISNLSADSVTDIRPTSGKVIPP